jgi:hypothetical protein
MIDGYLDQIVLILSSICIGGDGGGCEGIHRMMLVIMVASRDSL